MTGLRIALLLAALCSITLASASASAARREPNTPIRHFIVLMQENHTFDNYFGTYPGADGLPPETCMPLDPTDPASECVEPFHIGSLPIEDLDHSSITFRRQHNGGRMDGFIWALRLRNQDGRIAMGYYDGRDLPYYWNLASEYVLFDRFFSSAHGGSVWNHMYWIAGVPGSDKNSIPADGFPNDIVTIFDRLEEAGITWKFYIQNYDPSITYRTRTEIAGPRAAQVVWCPLLAMPRYLDDPDLFRHIVPLDEYFTDLQNGTLPEVAYIVPSGASEHPPGSIQAGQRFVRSLIQALMRSPSWHQSAFMVTYDDWGGWYDHVPPPQVDDYGYGFRVPAFLVSPYAKRGFIDSTTYDFTSILKFIEENWNLEPLAARDAAATSLANAFDFESPPRAPVFIPWDWPTPPPAPEPRRSAVYGVYSLVTGIGIVAFLVPTGRLRFVSNWLPRRFRSSRYDTKGPR
ncbi:alkaline phosphatase family protein [Thermomicrobium sp. 4228-Ro]|uniref:alkaline phosphatase family protein n=1 Tax=Thermomicrobium sp. 4228-Ro TaxID=2993937 RepID=UPI0022496B92|nr:alkaline phosphatase family protein [Thermomicrobium sp. 4228-Ro]MCX2728252.1 alkaline phosphatase family protein [Thermomicrobium sp. 4228-Ro]